jgi:hypothetical protein
LTRLSRHRPGSQAQRALRRHAWLELVQTSGPFLTLPVVDRVFPDGVAELRPQLRSEIRAQVAQAIVDRGASRHLLIDTVLGGAFDWDDHLRQGRDLPESLAELVADHSATLRPDFAFYSDDTTAGGENRVGLDSSDTDGDSDDGDEPAGDLSEPAITEGPWRMLGMVSPWGTHPLARLTEGGWSASGVERLAYLLRARDVPVGLVTDGRWWAVVWAPRGGTVAAGVFDAALWAEEPETLRGLVALLNRGRFLAVAPADTLPCLFRESLDRQEEVTETLGRQVREAVELLVAGFDDLDAQGDRRPLAGVSDDDVYDGAVTFMMRLVFLLFAEERRLLPSDDELYIEAYSVGRLIDQLEQRAALEGEQALEHRTGAWHRLLAVSRALHQGVAHEDLRLPAYGGGLFDPDRYPWLEGRAVADLPGTGSPLPIDDRTVLQMLGAVQYVHVGGERRRLTFRALDVEQIGYVYEGLLELEVRTADVPVAGLARPNERTKQKAPSEVPLPELIGALTSPDHPGLVKWLTDRTGFSAKRVATALAAEPAPAERAELVKSCGGNRLLADQLAPIASLLRRDSRGLPLVILPGSRYVTRSSRRAATGTHYTPRSLAEDVAGNTLEPLVYRPGPLDTPDRARWRRRPSPDILALRVADIAMGSGAFLVAACRYLADRVLEAWDDEGRVDAQLAVLRRQGRSLASDTEVEAVLLDARRLVAEHCLYGVDINPLAVEMAKLSLWLVTMDRERPFGFLDDRFLCGDSLLGLVSVDQLETVHVDPVAGRKLHAGTLLDVRRYMRPILEQAADLRRRITAQPVTTIRDVEHKRRLLDDANALTDRVATIAHALVGDGLVVAGRPAKDIRDRFVLLSDRVQWSLEHDDQEILRREADADLQAGRPPGTAPRRCLHWPLAFPEVFADTDHPGFDAIIGNPPFLGGKKISGHFGGDYLGWLQRWDGAGVKGSADLVARFLIRAQRLLSIRGQLGYLAVNTLTQGDTLDVGLLQAFERGITIRRARSSHKWPSRSASLEIVALWATAAKPDPDSIAWLDGEDVPNIGPDLEPVGAVAGRPYPLATNEAIAFIGSYVLGTGFTMPYEEVLELLKRFPSYAEILQPYVIGKDLSRRPDCSASRWIINFHDWPLRRCEDYPAALERVRRLVKPERDKKLRNQYRNRWWLYAERGVALYDSIEQLDHVLGLTRVGNAISPVRIPTGPVFSEQTVVFALDDFASLSFLSSSVHSTWAIRYTSTLGAGIRYVPSDVFLTLPWPRLTPELERLGLQLDDQRRGLMLSRSWGLTTTYNHVHSPSDHDPAVVELREIHEAIDRAVFDAYGWDDVDPRVGHYPTKIGTRWTISPEVRFTVLDRLLEMNHLIYEREQGGAPGPSRV